MKLKSVQIQNFKCIMDSNPFKVDEKVTCLVGKNESGKTAILQALTKINAAEEAHAQFDPLQEYPRKEWSDYERRHDENPDPGVTTTWELDLLDMTALGLGMTPGSEAPTVTVAKWYDNDLRWTFSFSDRQVVEHFVTLSKLSSEAKTALFTAETLESLRSRLEAETEPSEAHTALLKAVSSDGNPEGLNKRWRATLEKRLPKFAYFSEYHTLPGRVSVDDFKSRLNSKNLRESDRVFKSFLDFVGVGIDGFVAGAKFEALQARLEAVSANVSERIFKYWSQNRHLRVRVQYDTGLPSDPAPFNSGYVIRTRIENTRHATSTSFDDRSAGFVWFFSFLVWFSQIQKVYGNNVIVLLDEPAHSLHARAQADLLRYFEAELAPKHQVIYTTHSPFMVDPEHLLRARTVEDVLRVTGDGDTTQEEELGTKVGDDVLSVDRDTVFPLHACLGFEITQTLFVGPHALLVEGPSDLLYLKWFQRRLAAPGRISLDRRWTIAPCGGVRKVAAFMSLFGGNKLHVAVLVDFKRGDKSEIERLRKSNILQDDHILTVDSFSGKPEADIEDLLGDETYLDVVRQVYALATPISIAPSWTERIVPRVDQAFAAMPATAPEFDHYAPAEWLTLRAGGVTLAGLADAESRFESLFRSLNALLPPS